MQVFEVAYATLLHPVTSTADALGVQDVREDVAEVQLTTFHETKAPQLPVLTAPAVHVRIAPVCGESEFCETAMLDGVPAGDVKVTTLVLTLIGLLTPELSTVAHLHCSMTLKKYMDEPVGVTVQEVLKRLVALHVSTVFVTQSKSLQVVIDHEENVHDEVDIPPPLHAVSADQLTIIFVPDTVGCI